MRVAELSVARHFNAPSGLGTAFPISFISPCVGFSWETYHKLYFQPLQRGSADWGSVGHSSRTFFYY